MFQPMRLPHGTRWRRYFDGILIAAMVIAIGRAHLRRLPLERAFKTSDRLLSEVDEQLKPPAL
jgi:hypothetical protein